ncbi:RcpC/CpaB family pilus assembly protein [Sinomonas sp. ASV486]|uniref:RcpC/CpaB family pilus assembly protein n=1 Tax=Sinomonas sp. ASV486 TaxID=3051170 RepID=UPI0027DE1A7A|nr:RcpC/CpaB family pilus assembly protein [Sinomonas sp. ASV486]MDQ4491163.1 RcpC/CpaB family pilus assembly protein [Sinomonas sp. ASV486]
MSRSASPPLRRPQAPRGWEPARRSPLRRFIDRRRRTLAAALLCLGAGAAVYQLTPPSAALVPVAVAARDLAGGTTVSSGDLRIARLPAEAVPQRAEAEVSKIVGQRLAGPLRSGEVLTDAAVVGPGLLAGTGPGTSAVPVRMADPASLQLLSPGQLVDLVLSAETGSAANTASASTTLASRVPVLWTGKSGGSGQAGAWLGSAQDSEGLLVVGASPEQAIRIAGASTRGKVFFMLVEAGPR